MCQQEESYSSPIGILLLLQLSSYKPQWWGKIECGAVHECESKMLCMFQNLPIEGHSRIKINTQILDRWLKFDEWTGNWNGCNGFSQGFKRFGPWVEKSNGFRLGWIEVKTIVQEPVVNPLSARFYRSDLMCERRQVSTDIQPSVICVLMEGHNVTGIWEVRIYDTGNRWYKEYKKKWAKDRALGYTCGYCCVGWGWPNCVADQNQKVRDCHVIWERWTLWGQQSFDRKR